jgi:hypothetical protein
VKCIRDALLTRTRRQRRTQKLVRICPSFQPLDGADQIFIRILKLSSPLDIALVPLSTPQGGTSVLREQV